MTTITFEQWRQWFEKRLKVRTTEWMAFQTYISFLEQHPDRRPKLTLRADVRTDALRLIYRYTRPPLDLFDPKRKRDAYTRKALRDSIKQGESVIAHLRDTPRFDGTPGSVTVAVHHLGPKLSLSPLLDSYKSMVESSKDFLAWLECLRAHKPNVLDQGIGLALVLEKECKLCERRALALVRLALLAHGYPEDELEDLRDPGKLGAGNFRKRKKASMRRLRAFLEVTFSPETVNRMLPGE